MCNIEILRSNSVHHFELMSSVVVGWKRLWQFVIPPSQLLSCLFNAIHFIYLWNLLFYEF